MQRTYTLPSQTSRPPMAADSVFAVLAVLALAALAFWVVFGLLLGVA